MTTDDASSQNSGWAKFYPQLIINKAGRVLRWQVRCASAGIVALSVWRGEITPNVASPITLIGKHYVTVPEGMQNQLITYDVSVDETVLVEANDFVDFLYKDNEPKARVKTIVTDQTPEGEPIGLSFGKLLYDNDLTIGTAIVIEGSGTVRAPSLALYIG